MKRPLWALVCGCTCMFALPSVAQEQYDVNAIELIPLAEFPLRIYFFDGRQALDVSATPEYKMLSYLPVGDHPRLPRYIDLIAVVENRGASPVESIEVRLYRDRRVGDEISEEQLFRDWLSRDATLSNLPPHPRSLARWEGSVQVASQVIGLLDGNTTIAVVFERISVDALWRDLATNNLWPWEVEYEVQVHCVECSSAHASAWLRSPDSQPISLQGTPQGLQQLIDELRRASAARDTDAVYRTLATDFYVKRDWGGTFDPNVSAEENFSFAVYPIGSSHPPQQTLAWQRLEMLLWQPAFERKSDGQFCTPHGALEPRGPADRNPPRSLDFPITLPVAYALTIPQLCFKSTVDGVWEIAGHINGGE